MKRFSLILLTTLTTILFLCVIGLVSSCSSNSPSKNGNGNETSQIILNRYEITAIIGEKTALKVRNEYLFDSITWETENPSVAIVDSKGIIEAYGIGTTKIKAVVSKDNVAECVITVGLGNELPQIVIENECSEYKIPKSAQSFPFSVYVLFNGTKFYDAVVEYKSSDESVLTIGDGNSSFAIHSAGQAQVSLNATWRGLSFNDIPSLFKIVNVAVVEEVYFYVNQTQYADITLYTVDSFYNNSYENEIKFVPSVSVNGQISTDVNFTLP